MSNAAPPPPGNPYQANTQLSPADEKLWATLVHVGGIFFGFIPALIGYLVLKDRGPFVREHTKTALNFQISLVIYEIVAIIITVLSLGLLFIVPVAVGVAALVFMIIAAVKANQGQAFVYPLTIPFIR